MTDQLWPDEADLTRIVEDAIRKTPSWKRGEPVSDELAGAVLAALTELRDK